MIKCPNCGKQNQDHYKFCLGCGSELPREAARVPSPTAAPPSGLPGVAPAVKEQVAPVQARPVAAKPPLPAQPPAQVVQVPAKEPPKIAEIGKPSSDPAAAVAAPPPSPTAPAEKKVAKCPSCSAEVPADFAFCGRCGTRIAGPASIPPPAVSAAPAPTKPEVAVRGRVVMIQPSGAEGVSIPLTDAGTVIGRHAGEAFKDDCFLSPRHARFTIKGSTLEVEDEGSINGIYIRLAPEVPYELQDGDFIRIGQEVIKFELLPEPPKTETPILGSPRKEAWGRILLVLGKDKTGNAFTLEGKEALIGRERGNILFPEDGYVSGLHLKISREGGRYFVTDLKSSNGSYLRIRGKREIKGGDYLLVGQYLYRVEFQ